ncbi:hypothetical protein COX26_01765 [Candidatus Jorgensenbacteria bacterium CG23_combo_of_CG06-09_8_20_14_all_54_14]|uniref:HTH luxR-type domain-containing protein n=1 Tax=Candidatus Jorgensenbacteria bacterium CG23_combo_of_CG06-09_8_20_14_all_54_14 TaxID=1974595 RepID=A0A2G9Z9N7_9BACT|nr:MAG: hypothetical protein COX26_01765 [Candidatus Jorgensenbacteria bacterium CG23_combo_of_CG06-09_8_20_14_all_54_14]
MVNISKTQFPKELRKKVWRRFYELVKRSPSEETLVKNLAVLFTSSEITMLEKRLAIPLLLAKGLSYREIGRAIDVSPVTVSFIKHRLTKGPRVPRERHSLYPPRERKRAGSSMGRDRWRWLDIER